MLSQQQHHTLSAVLLVMALVMVGWTSLGPRHYGDVMAGEWAPGEVWIHGNAAATQPLGDAFAIQLSTSGVELLAPWRLMAYDCGPGELLLADDPGPGRFTTTMEFHAFHWDGRPAVASPQSPCPFPALHWAIAQVLDDISMAHGWLLLPAGGTDSHVHLKIHATDDRSYDPTLIDLAIHERDRSGAPLDSVAAFVDEASADFVLYSDLEGGGAEMPSVQFSEVADWHDADGDGRVGHGDQILLPIPAPVDGDLETVYFQLLADGELIAMHLMLRDSSGAVENLMRDPIPHRFLHDGNGTITVDGTTAGSDIPLASAVLQLHGTQRATATLAGGLPPGAGFDDLDADGMVSHGDRFWFDTQMYDRWELFDDQSDRVVAVH